MNEMTGRANAGGLSGHVGGGRLGPRSVTALQTVSRIWGGEKVRHYQWGSRGVSFCTKLCAAARQVRDWEEAVVKLNRLLYRRLHQSGRRGNKELAKSMGPDELINLRAWCHKDPYVKTNDHDGIALPFSKLAVTDLLAGWRFDKFGLMVRTAQERAGSGREGGVGVEGDAIGWGQQDEDRSGECTMDGSGSLASLKMVRQFWGEEKVRHYRWESRGVSFCDKLCAAARQVRDWDEAVVKLNRLIHRRFHQVGRQKVKASVNPIEQDDLINLRAWRHKDPYVKINDGERIALPFSELAVTDLPAGFGFDQFGLIVRTVQQRPGDVPEGGVGVDGDAARASQQAEGPSGQDEDGRVKCTMERPKRLVSLKTVNRAWGEEKARHYQWGCRGRSFCEKLCAAARQVRDWDEAVVKLNRLIHRRSHQVGRQKVKASVNPIEQDDLINLRAWRHKDPYVKINDGERIAVPFSELAVTDLPDGFGFDKFGLMARIGNVAEGGAAAGRKRQRSPNHHQPRPKRARKVVRQRRSDAEQIEDLVSVMRILEEEFAEKERLSREQEWSKPISLETKVSTVQEYYEAFHDRDTLPIHTCMICYGKFARVELENVSWHRWAASSIEKRDGSSFQCRKCFPVGGVISACTDCVAYLGRGALSAAAQLHARLGCEHMFPDELKGLTPVEEKLIALNSCYGFITKYSLPGGHRQGVRYPRHVKGHITVFPNNVQELVRDVLPHPLLKVMEEIHVSWHGAHKPAPSDLSALLSVRRRVVERALVWLKRHNPLYEHIRINTAEMDSWGTTADGVPSQIYDRLERNEPSASEKARTGEVVPRTERGLEEDGPVDIREILAGLSQGDEAAADEAEGGRPVDAAGEEGNEEAECESRAEVTHEISASGMFAVDAGPDICDAEKLQYVCDALGQEACHDERRGSNWTGSAEVRCGSASEPYIAVSRGEDFADSFDPRFFAKTFPTLFPFGNGGPRQAEESLGDTAEDGRVSVDADVTAKRLVLSRNMSLETWARLVVQRHGGRFARHHVFTFLIFNMGVRSRNRRASMASVRKRDFAKVERIVRSLTAERLEAARAELEATGKTSDDAVNQLLKSLSLYGFRQPMSRENRLSMRRKIKALIIRHGIPAIWFTLNPNDITNPVKLRLAAHRFREPDEAEAFLTSLDLAYKRTKLAISDPLSSAVFFHREMEMFFKYYVRTGEDSVFGRISQYFGAVETNERGALHLHGLLWLQGNMNLSTILRDVQGEDQASYRDRVIQYVDSVFSEDLDEQASAAVQTERSVTSDISSMLQNKDQFAAAFDEEANFCAGATQIHTHSDTCVKYSIKKKGQKGNPCRFKAPWKVVEKTGFNEDGVLQIRRRHEWVNRWNKAIAVGLRHNHDFAFIATLLRTLAIVYYVTNYATKVEDPVWKRVAAAGDVFRALNEAATGPQAQAAQVAGEEDGRQNKSRQFLMRVANRIFTERPLSQVEVVAHLLGYPTEFSNNDAWTFLNASILYWQVFRRWYHLRRESGVEDADESVDETVLLGESGERISWVEAYTHRGRILQNLSLYDYLSIVKLKRKGKSAAGWGELDFDSAWPHSETWVQALRRPGKHAVVCLDGHLSMDFSEEDELYHRRAAVQHLALFVPWESFLSETSGDVNAIWERQKQALPRRVSFLADNIQLLRRSAEDAKRDAKQWAAMSGETDAMADATESGMADDEEGPGAGFRPDNIGNAVRLIDVFRNAVGNNQITTGSKEISTMVQQLCRFQLASLCSMDDLRATMVLEQGPRRLAVPGNPSSSAEVPRQEQVRPIKSQQARASKERERMIQGMQSQAGAGTTGHSAAVYSVLNGFGEDDVYITEAESSGLARETGPSTSIQFGPATSFLETGRQLSEAFTLNRRQSIALRLICRQLDRVRRDEQGTSQLCQFVGGEGGSGKSRVIAAIAALFASKGISHRLLVTATSGTAAAQIDGITIHSACKFRKDGSRGGGNRDVRGIRSSNSGDLFIDGQARMEWQEKWLLIIDEASMLGGRTLYMVNEQLRKLRGCSKDFGGIPIVLLCGDFHQFRPVQDRPILLPSAAFPWHEEKAFRTEQRYQHDRAHALWKKFTTVVMLKEQVRAAGDPELRGLLTRIREGTQDRADLDLLNQRCYQEGKRIPWESGITVVTPLNKNRWNLNFEAVLSFQRQHQAPMRVFLSEHQWKYGLPTEEEALMMLSYGDDSEIPVPAIFMFVPGMAVVVNQNTHQGLKVTNGAAYVALDVILDKKYPGHRISPNTILHFGPPAGILLAGESTRDFHFVGMPAGTVLLAPITTQIECKKKRPWQQRGVARRGLPCAAAFACTDYKVQSRTLDQVVLELRGTRTTNIDGHTIPTQCDPYSLYVQLSRSRSLNGITLLSKARERDFIGNKVPDNMIAAEQRLETLSETTVKAAESWDWAKPK